MKVSTRNVFPGTVAKVTKGAVNSEVELDTKGGGKIVAIITNASVDNLQLKAGKEASALIKASWVILGTELHKVKMSTRNLLCGIVERVQEGAVNSEVQIKLAGGDLLTAIITNASLHSLGLRKGEHACAAFKASSVIVAVE
jgi:molybdate transport system regulatory protein